MADRKNPYMSPPKPIRLDAPESPEGNEPPKKRSRERGALPEINPIGMPGRKSQAPPEEREKGLGVFLAAQRSYGVPREQYKPSRRMPPPPPPIRPGEMPKRRKLPGEPKKQTRRHKPTFIQKVFDFKINPFIVSAISWSIAAVIIIVAGIWLVSGMIVDNAFAVYLDDEFIGYIPISDDLTSEEFHDYAILSLQAARGGVRVRVEQTVTIEPTRAPAAERNPRGDIIGILNRRFIYTIAATEIYVNGEFEAVMRTDTDLEYVEWLLQERWYNDNTVRAEFIESSGWETREIFVDPDEIEFYTPEQAYARLDRPSMQWITYIIQSGDTLGSISVRLGPSINRIMEDNGLTSTNIYPGNPLQIYTSRPLLGVRTYDEIQSSELIEMEVETIYRDDMPSSYSSVIQQGQSGQRISIEQIIRENGTEVARETLEGDIIIEPILHIVEVGRGTSFN